MQPDLGVEGEGNEGGRWWPHVGGIIPSVSNLVPGSQGATSKKILKSVFCVDQPEMNATAKPSQQQFLGNWAASKHVLEIGFSLFP